MSTTTLEAPSTRRVLERATAALAARRRAEVEVLDSVLAWAHAHVVTTQDEAAGWRSDSIPTPGTCAAALFGEQAVPLAGAGTPLVAEFAPAELAAALDLSHEAALALLGDVLDLAHRLPRLWALVGPLRVPVHLARRAAQESRDLPPAAADHADRLLVWRPRRLNPHRVGVLVHEARLYADPDRAIGPYERRGQRPRSWCGAWSRSWRRLGALDELFARIDAGEIELTGDGGFIPGLIKAALERGLQAELTEHLGYEKGDPDAAQFPNSRNGSTPKTVATQVGDVDLDDATRPGRHVHPAAGAEGQPPAGRAGRHDHLAVRGRDDGPRHRAPPGAPRSAPSCRHETISKITDEVARGGAGLAAPPAGGVLPGGLPRRAGGEGPRRRARAQQGRAHRRRRRHGRHQARAGDLGADQPRARSSGPGSAPSWPTAASRDVLIVCCDGLTGFPEAIEATWPQATVQTCVVHLIRAAMRFVGYSDRKAVAAALKPIYTAADADAAPDRAGRRSPTPTWAQQVPRHGRDLRERLGTVHPVPGVPARAAPGHLHHQLDRVAELPAPQDHQEPRPLPQRRRRRSSCCGWRSATSRTNAPAQRAKERGIPAGQRKAAGRLVEGQVTTNWKQALAQLALAYPDRINPHL